MVGLSDEDYLSLTEADLLLRDLYAQCRNKKPDDGTDAIIASLKHMETGYHVVGTKYSYILETVHNRKSFIFCLSSALKGFEDDCELTANELHVVIETICADFPRNLLTEAVLTATDQYNPNTLSADHKFLLSNLSRALMCHILFDEWLKAMEESFREEGKGFTMSISKIKARCEQLYRNLPLACPQPPRAAMVACLDDAGRQGGEMSFERFKKAMFNSDAVLCELRVLANCPCAL